MSSFSPNAVPVLEMESVDVPSSRVPGQPSIQGIDWRVLPREFWVIGGLLGSGKTDLLATAAGGAPPLQGSLRLFGQPMHQTRADEDLPDRLRVGLVHDGGLLLRHLTVAENISLPLRYHHNATEEDVADRLSSWLDATDLRLRACEFSSQISRIWARRAGLARACILEPEVLLLDNPLSGLDPLHARWWQAMLEVLAAGHPLISHRPMTIVVTCDDFRPWIGPGKRFALLRKGHFEVLDPSLPPDQLTAALTALDSTQ